MAEVVRRISVRPRNTIPPHDHGALTGESLSRISKPIHPFTDASRSVFVVAWFYLALAGLLETGWAISLKYTEGFTRLWPSLGTAVCMILSLWLLSLSLKTIPVGTGYPVWTGIGAVGTAILGMALFGESREVGRIVCIVLIVAGIAGLRYFTPSS